MRRRVPPPVTDRPAPPRWTQTYPAGLRYAAEHGHRGLTDQLAFLRAERARWCVENGCRRAGSKTCTEAHGQACAARKRAVDAA